MIASREYVKDLIAKVFLNYKDLLHRSPIGILVKGASSKSTTVASIEYTATQNEILLCFACASSSNNASIVYTLTASETGGEVIYASDLLNPANTTASAYSSVSYTWAVRVKKGDVITLTANTPSAGNSVNTAVCIVSTGIDVKNEKISFIDFKHESNTTTTSISNTNTENCYYINFAYAQYGTSSLSSTTESCTSGAVQLTKQLGTKLTAIDGGTTAIAVGTYYSVEGLTSTFTTVNSQSSGTRHSQWLYKIKK